MTSSVVYFIQGRSSGLIKIGTSQNLGSRLYSLRLAADEALDLVGWVAGSSANERLIHGRFAHRRVRGEWFSPHDDLLAFIQDVKVDGDYPRPGDDFYLAAARSWLEYLITRSDVAIIPASADVARQIDCDPGTLTNLRKRRLTQISARTYDRLQQAYAEAVQADVDLLKGQLAKLSPSEPAENDLAEIEQDLARLKQAIGTGALR